MTNAKTAAQAAAREIHPDCPCGGPNCALSNEINIKRDAAIIERHMEPLEKVAMGAKSMGEEILQLRAECPGQARNAR